MHYLLVGSSSLANESMASAILISCGHMKWKKAYSTEMKSVQNWH
jgi:hypothetical protein